MVKRHWDLWRVCGRDSSTAEARPIGHLVTGRQEFPEPVAFVAGGGGESLFLAVAIRDDPRKARKSSTLRKHLLAGRLPSRLLGMLLLPVNERGRRIANDGTFAGGMYGGDRASGLVTEFRLLTHVGLEDVLRGEPVSEVTQQESGAPVGPSVPTPASNRNGKAGKPTAA